MLFYSFSLYDKIDNNNIIDNNIIDNSNENKNDDNNDRIDNNNENKNDDNNVLFDKKHIDSTNIKKYKIKSLEIIKKDLNNVKSKLDEEFKNPLFEKYWHNCDPFKNEKKIIAKIIGQKYITNAWLKCFEIIEYYNLIPNKIENEKFIHFDNAAFPGSFILSTFHYINTKTNYGDKYQWYGNSLIQPNELNSKPLEDKFNLYKNYKQNWLMNENNNGDVLIENNQLEFRSKIGGTIDLYTSDLGFDVSNNYNEQELIHSPANVGQILSGLITLKKGGCFITKQYTTYEPITISIMYMASTFFNEFYLCKPKTSREANSETYLVGKGFKYNNINILDHPYIKTLFKYIKNPNNIPFFDAKDYPSNYLSIIIKSSTILSNLQKNKILADINRSNQGDNEIRKYIHSIQNQIEEWYIYNYIIPCSKKLNLL